MKTPATRSKPVPTKDEILSQITALLDRPDDDIQGALMKEILVGVIRLSESNLDVLDLKIVNRALKELRWFGAPSYMNSVAPLLKRP